MSHPAPTSSLPTTADAAVAQRRFDYTGIDEKTKAGLQANADQIRRWTNLSTRHVLAIGDTLILAKTLLLHGQFGPWLSAEFGWSERTAQRYMNAAKTFSGKSDMVSVLEPTAVYMLSAPSTPKAVRETVIAWLETGERPPLQEIKTEVTAGRKLVQQDKARQRAARQAQPRVLPVLPSADDRGREAAEFILKNLGEHRANLLAMLKGADANALVATLREGQA